MAAEFKTNHEFSSLKHFFTKHVILGGQKGGRRSISPIRIFSAGHSEEVWHLMCHNFQHKKLPPVFLEKGMRMGSKEYLEEVLKAHVKPWIDANFPDATNVVLMQDGAPCHTSKVVQKWLSENINFWPKDVWPPSSPDLNPLDFSIWAYVQAKSCDQQHPNLDHLKASVTEVWNNLSVTYIRNFCKRFRPRVEAVVAAEGGYIDK